LPQWGEKLLTRSLVYTGITRARQFFTLVQAQAGLLEQAIARPSRRASGLRERLGC
jgi:exodeoxyribonuclease V alpha subunit